MRRLKTVSKIIAGIVSVFVLVVAPVSAASTYVYDNIPSPQPGNLPSQAFEATGTSEFGGQIGLAGTERSGLNLKVLMSSWGCESGNWYSNDCVTTPGATFSHSITANVYAVETANAPGALLASSTETFQIPYRPSASAICGDGRWSADGTAATCFNGYATPIVFDDWSSNVAWPNNVIVSVAYNTSHYGYVPIGEAACFSESGGCGYDSLNVALTAPSAVGTMPVASDAYLNSEFGSQYCDGGTLGTDTFRYDPGCWTGYQPAYEVYKEALSPTNKDQCKNDGWKNLVDQNGNSFKNQGQCVSSVASNKQTN